MGCFYFFSFSILANYRGHEDLHLQAVLLPLVKLLKLCSDCVKDMEMLRMALFKPAQVQQGIVTRQGAVISLLLTPSCLACDTTPCCVHWAAGHLHRTVGVGDLDFPLVFSKLS